MPAMHKHQSLNRDDIQEVLAVLAVDGAGDQRRWRIAEVLDLLLETGNFRLALNISEDVSKRVEPIEARRLFRGYVSFCELLVNGTLEKSLATLQRYHEIIQTCGHSSADKTRMSLLLARAHLYGVANGALCGLSLLKARELLSVQLSTAVDPHERALLCIELTKSYMLADRPEWMAAKGVMSDLDGSGDLAELSVDVQFDTRRLEYLLNLGAGKNNDNDELRFRACCADMSDVNRCLAELTIQAARSIVDVDIDLVNKIGETLERMGFLSGAFEAYYFSARVNCATGRNVAALRCGKLALEVANRGGYRHGAVLTYHLLHEIYHFGQDEERKVEVLVKLVDDYCDQMTLLAKGAEIAELFMRCEKFSETIAHIQKVQGSGVLHLGSDQAVILHQLEAKSHSAKGNWMQARACWRQFGEYHQTNGNLVLSCKAELRAVQCDYYILMAGDERPSESLGKLKTKLNSLQSALVDLLPSPKAKDVMGEVSMFNAEILGDEGQSVEALKELSVAQNIFEEMSLLSQVALAESMSGVLLFEMGKRGELSILESSILAFRRADEFFRTIEDYSSRWKVLYYLASAAAMLAKLERVVSKRTRWHKLALGWVLEAEKCYRKVGRGIRTEHSAVTGVRFAPHLTIGTVRKLRRSISGTSARLSRRTTSSGPRTTDGSHLLH
jgi:tetratricopeptide (TPR) repeat protein